MKFTPKEVLQECSPRHLFLQGRASVAEKFDLLHSQAVIIGCSFKRHANDPSCLSANLSYLEAHTIHLFFGNEEQIVERGIYTVPEATPTNPSDVQ